MIDEISKHVGFVAELSQTTKVSPVRLYRTEAVAGLHQVSNSEWASSKEATATVKAVDRAQAEQLAQGLQQLVQGVHRQLSFEVDDDTGETVIQVIDADTDKVLRQIPSDVLLALQKRLAESQETGLPVDNSSVDGVLFNSRV